VAPSPTPECLLCRSTEHSVVFVELGIDVLRCRACGHVFSTFEGEEHYDGYFGHGRIQAGPRHAYWNEAHERMYADFARRFLAGRSGRLLDVGCGLGYFLAQLRGLAGWELAGCEISASAVEFAQTRLGLAGVRCGQVQAAGLEAASFDVITLWDVVEHLKKPDPLLAHLRTLLAPGGILFLHTPNARAQLFKARLKRRLGGMRPGTHYLEARDHLHLYSRATLARLLERCGFERPTFVHLRPIQGVAGQSAADGTGRLATAAKNAWYHAARLLHAASGRRVDVSPSLFALTTARRSPRAPGAT